MEIAKGRSQFAKSGQEPGAREGRYSNAQFAQEFLLIHTVLKGFTPVNEHYRDLVGIEAPDFRVGIYVDFAPAETAALVQLDEALLDDFA